MMFHDVLWCSMMFYDVLWCFMMFYVLRAFLVSFCRSVPPEFFRSFFESTIILNTFLAPPITWTWSHHVLTSLTFQMFVQKAATQKLQDEFSSFHPVGAPHKYCGAGWHKLRDREFSIHLKVRVFHKRMYHQHTLFWESSDRFCCSRQKPANPCHPAVGWGKGQNKKTCQNLEGKRLKAKIYFQCWMLEAHSEVLSGSWVWMWTHP